jgi:hypothetical protein
MRHQPVPWSFRSVTLALFASLAGFVTTSTPGRAQCQTWSYEPKFQFGTMGTGGGGLIACEVFDDGSGPKLFVGGENFFTSSGVQYVGRWDGHDWIPTGSLGGADRQVNAFVVHDDGQGSAIYAGGSFSVGGGTGIAKWNGSNWTLVGGGIYPPDNATVLSMTVYDPGTGPALYVGGYFSSPISNGLMFGGTGGWNSLGSGLTPMPGSQSALVRKLLVYDGGQGPELYVAGDFSSAGGQPITRIARWNGTSWNSLGSGINGDAYGMAVWDDGSGPKLLVNGAMTMAGGVPVSKIAMWNGTSWAPFPLAPAGAAGPMFVYDDGSGSALYVNGHAFIQGTLQQGLIRFDGTQWKSVGGGVFGPVHDYAFYDDGSGNGADLYAVGGFFNVGGIMPSYKIARWKRCPGPIDATCPGDQTLEQCPCQNYGTSGHGCENSAQTGGASITWFGGTSPDTLRLVSSGELPSALTIFLQGDQVTPIVMPFGDGLRCIGGNLLRLHVTSASSGAAGAPGTGNPSISQKSAALGDPLSPGDVRMYQAYYRDPVSPCGQFFNVSNGVRVVW